MLRLTKQYLTKNAKINQQDLTKILRLSNQYLTKNAYIHQ